MVRFLAKPPSGFLARQNVSPNLQNLPFCFAFTLLEALPAASHYLYFSKSYFQKKTRTDGPGSSDGKTVCMSTEEDEEDDFPLEDKVEEGYGVIHISMGKDTDSSSSDSETDLDISQFSRARISIPDEDEL